MSKKDEFKEFAKSNPNLASFVENGQMTWQKFYELYDIYDRDEKVWSKYTTKTNTEIEGNSIGKINDLIKNVNIDTIKEHISTAQKALDFVQELTSKTSPSTPKTGVSPRPLNKFFED